MRVGVIGMGRMGKHHARIWSEMEGVELAATSDPDPMASALDDAVYRQYFDHEKMLAHEQLDAVSICTPTATHASIVLDALDQRCHVLVEKPIAHNTASARAMLDLAAKRDRILSVGHVERFNPAVKALFRHLKMIGRIYHIAATRMGPMPANPPLEGMILDLAPHDLDLMRLIAGCEPDSIYAEGLDSEKIVLANIRFPGMACTLSLSWNSPSKHRRLAVWGHDGHFVVDYLAQTLSLYRGDEVIDFDVPREEPLRNELQIFAEAVQFGLAAPVDPWDGLKALLYAEAIERSIYEGRWLDNHDLRALLPDPRAQTA